MNRNSNRPTTRSRTARRVPRGRIAVAVGAACLAAAPGLAEAATGDYTLVQCHPLHRDIAVADRFQNTEFAVKNNCQRDADGNDLEVIDGDPAPFNHTAGYIWRAPADTRIVKVEVDAKLRNDLGYRARVFVEGDDAARHGFAVGENGSATYQHRTWTGSGQAAVGFELECTIIGGCKSSDQAKAFVRNLEITLRDEAPPTVTIDGPATHDGWVTGVNPVIVDAGDENAGLELLGLSAGGSPIETWAGACQTLGATRLVALLQPCESGMQRIAQLDSAATPLHDGENTLRVCATDFGNPGNQTCESKTIQVDNTAPTAGFANAQDEEDPELIRAPVFDATSGVTRGRISYRALPEGEFIPLATDLVGGEMQARVDSQHDAPGDYGFRLQVFDLAGNTRITDSRQNGSDMILHFPLKAATALTAELPEGKDSVLVGYREPSVVTGQLVDARRRPISGASVEVVETFDEGSLIDRRVRTVMTDTNGEYQSTIPGGPSREVAVSYDGSPRYIADESNQIDYNVKNSAAMRLSRRHVRAGERDVFSGSVGRYFARVPGEGKLVEVQVKERGDDWGTIREALRTDAEGKFRLTYQLRRFYTQPTTYKFRAKVAPEAAWPYKGTVRTPTRKLTILPSR